MKNQITFKTVFISGMQFKNVYKLDIRAYAIKNPSKVKYMHSINELNKKNANLDQSGQYLIVN